MSPFSSLTASPNLSIASSYAFMSPNHSPNSSMILPQAADMTGMSEMSDLLTAGAPSSSSPPMSEVDDMSSQPNSPTLLHTPPVIATPPHMKKPKYRILTIHLEKDEVLDWAVPVAGPHPKSDVMDITSCYLLGQWFDTRMGNLVVSSGSVCLYSMYMKKPDTFFFFIINRKLSSILFLQLKEVIHYP